MNNILIKPALAIFSLLLGTFVSFADTIQTFPVPTESKAAADYKLKVNGKEVFVYNSDYNPFAIFNFEGTVQIEIITQSDLKWVNIRPLSDNITWKIVGSSLFFSLDHPSKLSIEINNETSRALFLFAGTINSPDVSQGNVIRFIGGKIYNAGSIELKSNDVLYIEGGAVVRGMIHASNAQNIKIIGNGILDGTISGESRPGRMIDLKDCRNVLIQDIIIHNSPSWTIVPSGCNNVIIRNVKEINWKFGSDGIDLVSSSHVKIENCFLKDNDDCIAIKSFDPDKNYPDSELSRGLNVNDIVIDSCILWNMPWGNALEIGFELRCDSISHITFKNINIIHVERGAAISIHNGDLATVSDINYENINIENANQKLIDLAIFLSQYSIDRPPSGEERKARYMSGAWDGVLKIYAGEEQKYEANRGYINHIRFRNINVLEGPFPFSIICGYNTKHNIKDVIFDNLHILNKIINQPESGHFFINNADNILFNPD